MTHNAPHDNPTDDGSTDHEQTVLEPSPSTGWRETARALGVEPADAGGCGALGCHADGELYRVRSDSGRRVLCPDHVVDFLPCEVTV